MVGRGCGSTARGPEFQKPLFGWQSQVGVLEFHLRISDFSQPRNRAHHPYPPLPSFLTRDPPTTSSAMVSGICCGSCWSLLRSSWFESELTVSAFLSSSLLRYLHSLRNLLKRPRSLLDHPRYLHLSDSFAAPQIQEGCQRTRSSAHQQAYQGGLDSP